MTCHSSQFNEANDKNFNSIHRSFTNNVVKLNSPHHFTKAYYSQNTWYYKNISNFKICSPLDYSLKGPGFETREANI